MVSGVRAWLAGAAAVGVIAVIGVAIMVDANEPSPALPRVRVSAPGLDNETDVPPEESATMAAPSAVTEIGSIEEIRAAFDADEGHPRMILLVDPT